MIELLSGHTLSPLRVLHPSKTSLNQSRTAVSSGSMELSSGEAISSGDWIRIDTVQGSAGVFRATTIETDAETGTQTVSFEHLLGALADSILFGNLEPADLTGNESDTSIAQNTCIEKILGYQQEELWELGTCPFTDAQKFTFNNTTCLASLQTVLSSCEDWTWSFDMTSIPFVLNISTKPTTPSCEMRMRRNISTLKMSVDRSNMYTRLYPIGYQNLHITGNYVQMNTALYGVIEKSESNTSLETDELLTAWANNRLKRHAQPTVSVTISGVDLSATTGESLDRLTIGTMCRVPVRELNTTIEEIIEQLAWPDIVNTPEAVTVTLNNTQEDAKSFLESLASEQKSGGGGGSGGKSDKEYYTEIKQAEEEITLTYNKTVANTHNISVLEIDVNGISGRVTQTEGNITTMQSTISQQAEAIELKVSKSTLIDDINSASSSAGVTINATSVDLSGYVTASIFNTRVGTIEYALTHTLNANHVEATSANINQLTVPYTFKALGHTTSWQSITIDGTTYNLLGY